jgi:hypothetical protein
MKLTAMILEPISTYGHRTTKNSIDKNKIISRSYLKDQDVQKGVNWAFLKIIARIKSYKAIIHP